MTTPRLPARRRFRRTTAIVAGGLGAALALAGCTPEPAPDTDVDWELTATTDAPSGDIDSYTWVSYAEPFSLPVDEIHRSTVVATWIDGELVYSHHPALELS